MRADFQFPTPKNDMKLVVYKNNLVDQILYRSLVPIKKNSLNNLSFVLSKSAPSWKYAKIPFRKLTTKMAVSVS